LFYWFVVCMEKGTKLVSVENDKRVGFDSTKDRKLIENKTIKRLQNEDKLELLNLFEPWASKYIKK